MHTFLEFPELVTEGDGVYDIMSLVEVVTTKENTAHAFGGAAVKHVRDALQFPTVPQFANCRFAFADQDSDGFTFVEIDSKGKASESTETPKWFVPREDFARSGWLKNRGLDGDALIPYILDHSLEERRRYCDLLFNLQLDQLSKPITAPSPAHRAKLGNRQGKSTKPKVQDLQSLELFTAFFKRLQESANSDQFPTLQALAGVDDLADAPPQLKQTVRTWFKAVAGEQVPNNKRIAAGGAALYCAPLRERLKEISKAGIDNYYQSLSQAIAEAGDQYIADFSFSLGVDSQKV